MEKEEMNIFKKHIEDKRFFASEGWDIPRESNIIIISGHEKYVNPKILEQYPNLSFVITRSAGYNHLPLEYLKDRGISAYRITDYGSVSVAEHAIALMFALAKHLKENEKFYTLPFERANIPLSMQVTGKTFGVIGVGYIGKALINFLRPWGPILAYSRTPKNIEGVTFTTLEEVLSKSNIVFLTVAYNKSTHHLINLENIKLLQDNAILVNVSRGEVVQTEALLWALEHKRIKVGLDVIEGETLIFENVEKGKQILGIIEKIRNANSIVTPHNAYYSDVGLYNMVMHAYNIATKLLNNEPVDEKYKISYP